MKQQNNDGLIVFISGGPRGRGDLVYVDWVEEGYDLALLRDVKRHAPIRGLGVLAVAFATKRDVGRFYQVHKSDYHYGNWFKFTPSVMRGLVGEIKRERAELRAEKLKRAA